MTDQPAQAGPSAIRRRALWWATMLCDHPDAPDAWDFGGEEDTAVEAVLHDVRASVAGDEETHGLAAFEAVLASGSGGLVVLLHSRAWSLAARAGGPMVIVCAEYPDGLTVQHQPIENGDPAGTTPASHSRQATVDLIDALIARARHQT